MKNHECGALKVCTTCNEEKGLEFFSKNKKSKDGYLSQCKSCLKAKRQKLKYDNIEIYNNQLECSRRAKQKLGKAHLKAYKEKWHVENIDRVRLYRRQYYLNNRSTAINNAKGRYKHLKVASVIWANREAILAFYKEAKRLTKLTGIKFNVDHIIPLRGKTVSGLHVDGNLQIITAYENSKKYITFDDDICCSHEKP